MSSNYNEIDKNMLYDMPLSHWIIKWFFFDSNKIWPIFDYHYIFATDQDFKSECANFSRQNHWTPLIH